MMTSCVRDVGKAIASGLCALFLIEIFTSRRPTEMELTMIAIRKVDKHDAGWKSKEENPGSVYESNPSKQSNRSLWLTVSVVGDVDAGPACTHSPLSCHGHDAN